MFHVLIFWCFSHCRKHKLDPFSSSNLNITKLREYHFCWGLGGAKSETHSQKNKKLPKSETHSQKTRNYLIKINQKHRSIYSYSIQIYTSSQSRLTQVLYQTRYKQYFETLKFMEIKKAIRFETHPQITCYYPIKSQF